MKLTIIPVDGAVYKDGYSYSGLDLATAPSNVHALQWKDTKGWIEFKDNDDGTKPQNEVITELPSWANACVTKWDEAETARLAAVEAAKLAAEEAAAAKLAAEQ
jgi:hypothetical protein